MQCRIATYPKSPHFQHAVPSLQGSWCPKLDWVGMSLLQKPRTVEVGGLLGVQHLVISSKKLRSVSDPDTHSEQRTAAYKVLTFSKTVSIWDQSEMHCTFEEYTYFKRRYLVYSSFSYLPGLELRTVSPVGVNSTSRIHGNFFPAPSCSMWGGWEIKSFSLGLSNCQLVHHMQPTRSQHAATSIATWLGRGWEAWGHILLVLRM